MEIDCSESQAYTKSKANPTTSDRVGQEELTEAQAFQALRQKEQLDGGPDKPLKKERGHSLPEPLGQRTKDSEIEKEITGESRSQQRQRTKDDMYRGAGQHQRGFFSSERAPIMDDKERRKDQGQTLKDRAEKGPKAAKLTQELPRHKTTQQISELPLNNAGEGHVNTGGSIAHSTDITDIVVQSGTLREDNCQIGGNVSQSLNPLGQSKVNSLAQQGETRKGREEETVRNTAITPRARSLFKGSQQREIEREEGQSYILTQTTPTPSEQQEPVVRSKPGSNPKPWSLTKINLDPKLTRHDTSKPRSNLSPQLDLTVHTDQAHQCEDTEDESERIRARTPISQQGRSYATAAKGIKIGGSDKPLSVAEKLQIQNELNILQDNVFLQEFFRKGGKEKKRWRRFVVRLRYIGRDFDSFTRDWVTQNFIEEFLQLTLHDILAVVSPIGMREIDVCFETEAQYLKFWDCCKAAVKRDPLFLKDVTLVPLFRGETKVLNISFRTTAIPIEDLDKWLKKRCRVLLSPQRKKDDRGVWSAEYRAIIQLEKDSMVGRYKHLPKYFFMGADRGITRYSGQPPACFLCGSYWHKRATCNTELCSKCGTEGHKTNTCNLPVKCTLCDTLGHEYEMCPKSQENIDNWEEYMEEVEMRREEAERRAWREAEEKEAALRARYESQPIAQEQEHIFRGQMNRTKPNSPRDTLAKPKTTVLENRVLDPKRTSSKNYFKISDVSTDSEGEEEKIPNNQGWSLGGANSRQRRKQKRQGKIQKGPDIQNKQLEINVNRYNVLKETDTQNYSDTEDSEGEIEYQDGETFSQREEETQDETSEQLMEVAEVEVSPNQQPKTSPKKIPAPCPMKESRKRVGQDSTSQSEDDNKIIKNKKTLILAQKGKETLSKNRKKNKKSRKDSPQKESNTKERYQNQFSQRTQENEQHLVPRTNKIKKLDAQRTELIQNIGKLSTYIKTLETIIKENSDTSESTDLKQELKQTEIELDLTVTQLTDFDKEIHMLREQQKLEREPQVKRTKERQHTPKMDTQADIQLQTDSKQKPQDPRTSQDRDKSSPELFSVITQEEPPGDGDPEEPDLHTPPTIPSIATQGDSEDLLGVDIKKLQTLDQCPQSNEDGDEIPPGQGNNQVSC